MVDMTTSVGGVALKHPIFNASGPKCASQEELQAIADSNSSAIMSKSCTLEPREGNPTPRYHDFGANSINSMGLPNLGYKEYIKIHQSLADKDKPRVASVSGMSYEDNIAILKELVDVDAIDLIELNLSCPNIPGKPQVGYDFETSEKFIKGALEVAKQPLGVKLPPYFDMSHFQSIAEVLNKYPLAFVTCINSIGNGLVINPDTEEVVIKPKGGFGGIGGPTIKPTALANARKLRELLKPDIAVIGCGGITTGTDVFEYILAGADAVQIGTVFHQEGTASFDRILTEFEAVMQKKGYTSLSDFKNKLKTL